ncbi:unnamed protein product [Rotaria sp. Silwood2]|nr:unnamed protein product [Rotaria sp. Silwood2]CAF4065019.1 unnamed protein product [Rotaria sp. Silwood2]
MIESPSQAAYEELYDEHSSTIECPCSRLSVPYGSFLNVTFVLHQVCSSDFVSPIWLNYLALFNPNRVPLWTQTGFSRDFRTIGALYFQFLESFCSLVQRAIADGQRTFSSTKLINRQLLPRSLFVLQTEAMVKSFVSRQHNEFVSLLNWIEVAGILSQFLSGTNMNFRILIGDGNQVEIYDSVYQHETQVTSTSVLVSANCSCAFDTDFCFIKPLIYTNGTNVLDFVQVFDKLHISCVPWLGFLNSEISWWYNMSYIQNILETYGMAINSQSPSDIKALNRSVPTRFPNGTTSDLIREIFLETVINNETHFNLFYDQCAPITCSYRITRRRDFIVGVLLLINVCGGLNRGLQILLPLICSIIFFCIDKWKKWKVIGGMLNFVVNIFIRL